MRTDKSIGREQWVDVARGMGIVLVVWGHVLRANVDLTASPWAAIQDRWLYAFHMPLFFLLSGLFLFAAISRGRSAFLRGRWWAVLWPYLLWSVVIGLTEVAVAPYVNTPIQPLDVALIPVQPIEQYWFLYALLICQLAAVAAWPSAMRLWIIAAMGMLALSIVGGAWIGIRAFAFLPYVAAGVGGAHMLAALSHAGARVQLVTAAAAWALFALAMLWLPSLLDGPLGRLAPGFLGTLATIATAMAVAKRRGWIVSMLAALGQASLAIFVLHTLFSAGTRVTLSMAGVPPPSLPSLVLCFLAGVVAPFVAFRMAQAHGLTRQLGFGGGPLGPPRMTAAPAPA